MRFSYPIPKTDDDFEHLCWQLLKQHWNRPFLQRYAHRGEKQDGVDIFDPSQTKPIHAAQCKLKEYGKTIAPRELQAEVDKVTKHTPSIDHFAILTTGKKSRHADRKVAEINRYHQQHGLFNVELLTWDQIEALLDQYAEVRDPIYSTLSGQVVATFHQELIAIRATIEASSLPATDALNRELDDIKAATERHEFKLAHHLAKHLEERHGDKLTPRQWWRLLTLQANILLGEGIPEQAGALLLKAKHLQPEEEKAQVNEALGFELTGDRQKARSLAIVLREQFPYSSAAAALWVRTAPDNVGSAELEATFGELAGKDSEISLALSFGSLRRGDVDRAEKYARRCTELEPDFPQAWLLLGQAVHVRGVKEVHVQERLQLLQQAVGHYSKAVELAHAERMPHIEAAALLNRGIVRDLLRDEYAEQDFRAARAANSSDKQPNVCSGS
jgi:tetratricopeptide (TPR) repeat protein